MLINLYKWGGVYAGVPVKYICSVEEFADKFLKQMPEYNYDDYKKNKKAAVLSLVEKFPTAKFLSTN